MLKTLHSKLLIFFLLITFIPMFFVGYISYHSQKKELTKLLEQDLFYMVDDVAIDVEIYMAERLKDLNLLMKNQNLRNPNSTFEESQKEFLNFLDVHEGYFGAIFIDVDGTVTVDMDNTVLGRNLGERVWFKKAMEGEVYFSDIYLSTVVNSPIVALAAPIKDDNDKIIGVISPSFDLDNLWQQIDRFSVQRKQSGLSDFAFLINNKGDIIAHPDRNKILKENFFNLNNLDNQSLIEIIESKKLLYNKSEDRMIAFSAINRVPGFDNDWYLGISVDKNKHHAPLKSLSIMYSSLFSVVMFFTIIAIIKLSKYIVAPVEKLVIATSKLGLGEKVKPLDLNTYKEINTLAKTFNSMTEKLEIREKGHKKSTLIIETSNNGVISLNKNNKVITTFNKKCEEIFKIDKRQVIGKNILELSEQFTNIKIFFDQYPIYDVISDNEIKKTKNIEHNCVINKQQYTFLTNISNLPTSDYDNEEEILIIFSDISEKRKMEEELIRHEKLKVAGQLAAGVAHEIRNPLTTIKGFLQLFNESNGNNYEKQKYQLIIDELDRIDDIVSDFLTIAKPNPTNKKTIIDIGGLLNETLYLVGVEARKKDIKIKIMFSSTPPVYINDKNIKQVFINIIKNAFESMTTGGTLTIMTEYYESEQFITISFYDTGHGIDKETLKKLGTPFFTTKEDGTGLGLMTCFRIIEEMQGTLTIESEPDVGSVFTIKIPISEKSQ